MDFEPRQFFEVSGWVAWTLLFVRLVASYANAGHFSNDAVVNRKVRFRDEHGRTWEENNELRQKEIEARRKGRDKKVDDGLDDETEPLKDESGVIVWSDSDIKNSTANAAVKIKNRKSILD